MESPGSPPGSPPELSWVAFLGRLLGPLVVTHSPLNHQLLLDRQLCRHGCHGRTTENTPPYESECCGKVTEIHAPRTIEQLLQPSSKTPQGHGPNSRSAKVYQACRTLPQSSREPSEQTSTQAQAIILRPLQPGNAEARSVRPNKGQKCADHVLVCKIATPEGI